MTSRIEWTASEVAGRITYEADLHEVEARNTWHDLFRHSQWILTSPAEEVVDFHFRYLENPTRQLLARGPRDPRRIHDLGCGGGRHVCYFAELGYDVTGTDLSTRAVAHTQAELERRGLQATVVQCPMTALALPDASFDVTISRAVINHATVAGVKKAIYEVARTTRKDGLFFVTFSSVRASDWRRGVEIEQDVTYVPHEGPEAGLVHTFVDAANAAALVEPFFRVEEVFLSEHAPLMAGAPGATPADQYFGSEYVVIGVRR